MVKNIVIFKVVFTLFLSSSLLLLLLLLLLYYYYYYILLLLYLSHFHAKFSSFYRPYNHCYRYYIIFVVRCHHG